MAFMKEISVYPNESLRFAESNTCMHCLPLSINIYHAYIDYSFGVCGYTIQLFHTFNERRMQGNNSTSSITL